LRRKLFAAGLSVAILRATGAILGFVVTIVISRTLGTSGLGIYAYAVTIIVIATVPVSYGWGTSLLRSASTSHFSGDWRATSGLAIRGAQFAFLLAVILLGAFLALRLMTPEFLQVLNISIATASSLTFVFLFDQLSALRASILRGLDRPITAQAPEMLVRPLVFVIAFFSLAWWLGEGVAPVHAFIALSIAAFVSAIAGYGLLRWRAPTNLKGTTASFDTRSWLASASPIALSSGLIVLNSHLDILILGIFVEAADIGIYRVAVQTSLVSGLAYTSLNMLASQRFAFAAAAGDRVGVKASATFMARIAVLCSIPLLIVLILAGQSIVPYVFGENFGAALGPMIVLAFGQSFTAATGMAQPLLLMNGLEKHVMYWTSVSVVMNILLCLIFIPLFGVIGAAFATVIAAALWNVALWSVARARVGVDTSIIGLS